MTRWRVVPRPFPTSILEACLLLHCKAYKCSHFNARRKLQPYSKCGICPKIVKNFGATLCTVPFVLCRYVEKKLLEQHIMKLEGELLERDQIDQQIE